MSEDDPEVQAHAAASPQESGNEKKKLSLFAKLRIVVLVLSAAVILIVFARNWEPVSIDLMGKKIEIPLSVLVILTFLLGTIIGLLLAYIRPWRKHR